MYVCNCHGVSESELARSIGAGARTLKALRESLGVGSCCGKCIEEVREALHRDAPHGCTGCGRCRKGAVGRTGERHDAAMSHGAKRHAVSAPAAC